MSVYRTICPLVEFRKKMDCTTYLAKPKAVIFFLFAYANSNDPMHMGGVVA